MLSDVQPETSGYSIWLEFGRSKAELRQLINLLSRRLGTPAFSPHITLAGQLDYREKTIIEKTSWLASVTDPFKVRCNRFGYEHTSFFKAFYLEVALNNALKDLRNIAEDTFKITNQLYLPHISLLYGYPDSKIRENLISELGNRLPVVADVTVISVIKSYGQVANWELIREYELGN
jgi:2'-5' RNA ligase